MAPFLIYLSASQSWSYKELLVSLGIFVGSRNTNSGLLVCTASAFSAELPSPPIEFLTCELVCVILPFFSRPGSWIL